VLGAFLAYYLLFGNWSSAFALYEDKYIFVAYLTAWLSPVLFRWILVNLILLSKSEKGFDM
jgi:hypothetical protein